MAGSPRSDDDKAGTPLSGLSCSCWVLHKPIEKSSAWGQKTLYYNRPTQDGLSGHFVLRAIGKRFRKDRTAGCEKVVGIRFALDSSLEGSGFELSVPLGHLHQTRPLHHRVELYIDTGVAWQDAGGGRRGRCWPWSGSQQSPVAISGSVAKTGSVSPSTPMLL